MLMRLRGGGGNRSRQAITDLYDEKRGAFLVQYPIWLVLTLGLVGIAAFAITGFTGYEPGPPFGEPWILYLWFCALVVTLQASIFRNRALRVPTHPDTHRHLHLYRPCRPGRVWQAATRVLPTSPQPARCATRAGDECLDLHDSQFRYHSRLLGGFGSPLDQARAWHGAERRDSPPARRNGKVADEEDLPSLEELISGDFLAGAALTLVLSFLFSASFVQLVVLQPGVDVCTVSLPFAGCVSPGDPNAFYTLSYLDRVQSLIYLPFGLVILGLTATLSGLSAAAGVSPAKTKERLASAPRRSSSATAPIAMDVTDTVVSTLRSAIDRRVRHLVRNTALSLRTVAWPLLVLLCIYGVDQVLLHSAIPPRLQERK